MRKPIVAGNWKMNKTASEAETLIQELKPLVADSPATVVVCPTFVCLDRAAKALAGSNIHLGAQDVYFEASGAYTSQISIDMLKDVCVEYVILGHSERRQYFGETDESVNKKTKVVLEAGLIPIVCVGETLEEREAGKTNDVVATQVKGALAGLSAGQVADLIIAYEPVWAIGTGKVATTEQAQEVHAAIRNLLGDLYDTGTAEQVRIQYGGSMKPDNAPDLLAQTDIDGGLIGGAALKADSFAAICNAATE